MPDDHDAERVQDSARERQHERAERVEDMLGDAGQMLDEHKYPTTSEELATEYGDQPLDLPNETETLGSVFDRLVDERFESRRKRVRLSTTRFPVKLVEWRSTTRNVNCVSWTTKKPSRNRTSIGSEKLHSPVETKGYRLPESDTRRR